MARLVLLASSSSGRVMALASRCNMPRLLHLKNCMPCLQQVAWAICILASGRRVRLPEPSCLTALLSAAFASACRLLLSPTLASFCHSGSTPRGPVSCLYLSSCCLSLLPAPRLLFHHRPSIQHRLHPHLRLCLLLPGPCAQRNAPSSRCAPGIPRTCRGRVSGSDLSFQTSPRCRRLFGCTASPCTPGSVAGKAPCPALRRMPRS
mmetsp:Transcript_61356/g.179328  ORF Transcript_61356/g.179328 Transcript_61356/m.179328 type:complete len:206 (+) Transcript_61356:285-902(+)